MKIGKTLEAFAQFKVWYGNATFYVSLANFIMLLSNTIILYKIGFSIWVLVPIAFGIMILIGIVDYKLIFPRTTIYSNKKNDMRIQQEIIKAKLDKILEKLK